MISPLAELRPEAEPPLPAAHEMLRGRTPALGVPRRDPTPARAREPAAQRETATGPRALIAAIADAPQPTAPGPIVDPSAWFGDSAPKEGSAPRPLPPIPGGELREWSPVSTPTGSLMTPTPQRLPGPEAAEASIRAAALREFARDHATAPGHHARAANTAAPIELLSDDPLETTEPPAAALVERSPMRRAIFAVFCCLAIGALVGWLLSSPSAEPRSTVPTRSQR